MIKTCVRPLLVALALFSAGAAAAEPAAGGVRQACQADRQKFCADVHGFGVMGCMKKHADELSEDCKAAWHAHHKPNRDMRADQGAGQTQ